MTKMFLKMIIPSILLISGCNNQEEKQIKIEDNEEKKDYLGNPNILDAVIDTEEEKNYIKSIELKYIPIKNEYEKKMTEISVMIGKKESSMGIMVEERKFLEEAIREMNRKKEEINNIYMPNELKNMINSSINMKIESYKGELKAIKNIEGNIKNQEQRQKNFELYKKVKDQNIKISNYFIDVLS